MLKYWIAGLPLAAIFISLTYWRDGFKYSHGLLDTIIGITFIAVVIPALIGHLAADRGRSVSTDARQVDAESASDGFAFRLGKSLKRILRRLSGGA